MGISSKFTIGDVVEVNIEKIINDDDILNDDKLFMKDFVTDFPYLTIKKIKMYGNNIFCGFGETDIISLNEDLLLPCYNNKPNRLLNWIEGNKNE